MFEHSGFPSSAIQRLISAAVKPLTRLVAVGQFVLGLFCVHVHVGRRERGLLRILPGMRQVITPGRHRHRSGRLSHQARHWHTEQTQNELAL